MREIGKYIMNGLFILAFSAIGYGFKKLDTAERINARQNERLLLIEDDQEEDQQNILDIKENQQEIKENQEIIRQNQREILYRLGQIEKKM